MSRKPMIEAIRDAMDVMMERDDDVVVFGEDVGFFGGVFRATQGLQAKYGTRRCFDTPISELGIVGAAVGMAAYGLRPCVEIQFADYMYPAYDQVVSEAARLRYRSNGQFVGLRRGIDRNRHWPKNVRRIGLTLSVLDFDAAPPSYVDGLADLSRCVGNLAPRVVAAASVQAHCDDV